MSWNSMQDGRYTKTYVSISGVDYTEEMMGFKMESDIEGESKSSVFGSINVENLEFTINGKLPNYEQEYAEIKFGLYTRNLVFGEEVPYTVREYSSFVITEQEYDDKSDETKFKAMTDVRALDEKVTIPLVYTTNEVINGTLKEGESVVLPSLNLPIEDTSDKYYERRMDLYQDIAAITGTYIDVEYIDGNLRYVFRDFGRKASQSALDSLEGFIQDGSSIYKDFSVVSGDHYSTTLEVRNTGQGQATISFEGFGSHTIEAGQYKVINFIGQATKNTYRLTLSGDIDIIAYSQPSEVPVFELEIGETMAPIDTVHLRYPSGDNVSLGDESSGIVFEDIEIIKDRREELLPDILGRIQGMSYTDYDVEYPGDPFIRIGEIVTVADKDGLYHDVYVTASTLEDNGAWQGKLSAKIVDLEAVETNYVGTYDKEITKTNIVVDKVNQVIDATVQKTNEQGQQLGQFRIELDEISQTVSNIDTTNNVIPNFQGYNGYKGWSWVGGSLKAVTGLTAMPGLRQSTNWIRRAVDSDAIYRLEFFTSGRAISPKGFVTGGEEYSYNTKVHNGTQGYTLTVREFDAIDGAVQHETPFSIDTNELNPYFTFTLQPNTRYVDLAYDIPTTVTPTNTLSVTEQVFNKGRPGEYSFSVAEFVNKTESKITQLSDSVTTTVTKVETLDGQVIENTSRISQNATNISLKANTIDLQGKVSFSDLSTQGRTQIYGSNIITGTLKATDATFVNATITGNLNAGTVGNLLVNSSGITFPNGKLKLNATTNSIDVGTLRLQHSTSTTQDFGTTDVLAFGTGSYKGLLGSNGGYSFIQTVEIYSPTSKLTLGRNGTVIIDNLLFMRSQNGNWWHIDVGNNGGIITTRRNP